MKRFQVPFCRAVAALLCLLLTLCLLPVTALGAQQDPIVILYENDVHCAVEGYSKLSAMKKELQQTYAHVGVVSAGDYIQGGSLGAVSKGAFIVELMNAVGYDAVTLGNHEFDYQIPRLLELAGQMDTGPICCNFWEVDADASFFPAYSLHTYGDVTVAFVGITTPTTITSSKPAQFRDSWGKYLYTFHPNTLYAVVQDTVDAVRAAGADYVIALSHIGMDVGGEVADVVDLIINTRGLDVVLDGHSHSVIPELIIEDAGGDPVILTSTGTGFANIGKLTITDRGITTELIDTETYTRTDPAVNALLERIQAEFDLIGERVIGTTKVDLVTHDADGNRLVRTQETNLGNLISDAFLDQTGAQIAYVNGGGLRAPLEKGEITYNDLLSVLPFNDQILVAEVTGQNIRDMLERTVCEYPEETGSFPHVAGLTFSIDTAMESNVRFDENDVFIGVSGAYRVYNIKVRNPNTGEYEPLHPNQIYTLAISDYYLRKGGGGMSMLNKANILGTEFGSDTQLVEDYITERLGGEIGYEYADVQNRIAYREGKLYTVTYEADGSRLQEAWVEDGEAVVHPPVPAKEGYVGKWDHDGSKIHEDLTIHAFYVPLPEQAKSQTPDTWVWIAAAAGYSVVLSAVTVAVTLRILKKRKKEA